MINFKVWNSFLLGLFLIMTSYANAQTTAEIQGKQSFGLFYTSNADLSSSKPVADTYTRLDSKWYGDVQYVPFYLGLAWLNYGKEKSNNMLSLTLSAEKSQENGVVGGYRVVPKIFHRNYIFNTAATSDVSFTNSGIGIDFEKTWQKSPTFNISALIGFESRHFPQFENRWDHEGHINANIEYDLSQSTHLIGFSGLGAVYSGLAEYSRSYLDFGFGAQGPISESWTWSSEFQISQKNYFQRTVSQATEITNRRGNTSTFVSTTNERASVISSKALAAWKFDSSWSLQSGLYLTAQSSNNSVNSYNDFEVFTSIIYRGP